MKAIKIFFAAALATAMFAACSANKDPKVEAPLPSAAEVDSVSYLVGFNFGYFIKANGFGKDLNYAQIKKGMMDFINCEIDMNDPAFKDAFKVNPDEMNSAFNSFITKMNNYKSAVNEAKSTAFLDANKLKSGVVVTESGLQYKILEDGNEVHPAATDTVWVNYRGTLIDGTEFDASKPENEPVQMLLNRVIKGWTEGLQLIGEGGKIQLVIPADLAYGSRSMGKIEPNSTLVFDVELVKVGKVAPAAEEE